MVDIMSDQQREADQLINQGIDHYDEKDLESAHQCFKKAYNLDPEGAKANSWYGLTLALVEDKVQKGLDFCKKAILSNIPDALFYRNIGQVYLKFNNKHLAVTAFQKGLSIDKGNSQILKLWRTIGIRRKPFLKFLPRENFLNKMLGKMTWRNLKTKHLYKT